MISFADEPKTFVKTYKQTKTLFLKQLKLIIEREGKNRICLVYE